jgi:uncharacterized protein (DUF2062 family)
MKLKFITDLVNYITRPFIRIISRILKIGDDPKKIACGFALGTFLGFMPLIGLQAAIAVIIASLLKWNKVSAGIAVFNTNIVTGPFIFGISYFIGASVLGFRNKINFPDKFGFTIFWDLITRSYEIFLSLCFGGVLLGIPTSILAYYLSHFVIKNYQLRMASKRKVLMN